MARWFVMDIALGMSGWVWIVSRLFLSSTVPLHCLLATMLLSVLKLADHGLNSGNNEQIKPLLPFVLVSGIVSQ